MSKPKKLVCNHLVIVVRRDERLKRDVQVEVPAGTAFEFTDTEIEDIIRAQGEDSLRKPVNEDPDAVDAEGDDAPIKLTAKQKAAAKKAAELAAGQAKPPKDDTNLDDQSEGGEGEDESDEI